MITNSFHKSLVAQQYYPPGFADSVFAQACVLARTLGLHQTLVASDSAGPEEQQERFKVFQSLYLRDKSFTISRGSFCWLPSSDCSLSSQLDQSAIADPKLASRVQLAKLQEEIYRLFHPAQSLRRCSIKHKTLLLRIEQSLECWADTHDIFTSVPTNPRDVDLQLEFLAARISALRGSPEPVHIRRVLNDARASCLLLLISYGKCDQSMFPRPDSLSISKSPSLKSLDKSASRRSSKGRPSSNQACSGSKEENANQPISLRSHSLPSTFSAHAFFLLAGNLIQPISTYDESQADEDMNLLQKVCACYKELEGGSQANNHTRKVGYAFERLLEVVNLIKNYHQLQPSPTILHQGSTAHTPPSTQNLFAGPQGLPDFTDLSALSSYPAPLMPLEGFSSKSNSTAATNPLSTCPSPGLLTPMELEFFSPHFQQQQSIISHSGRKRVRLNEPNAAMDDLPNSRLLSEILAASPMLSFDGAAQEDINTAVL